MTNQEIIEKCLNGANRKVEHTQSSEENKMKTQYTKVNVPTQWVALWGNEAWRNEEFAKIQKGGSMNSRLDLEKRFKFKPGELVGSFTSIN